MNPQRPDPQALKQQALVAVRTLPAPWLLRPQMLALCLLAALLGLSLARAETAVYYADDIQTRPVMAQVAPGFLTIVEFYQDIDQISSGRPDLLHVEAAGAKMYVSALGRAGSTDLVIEIGGRTQLVHIQIKPGNSTRRYVVELDKPPPVPRVTKAPPAPAAVARVSAAQSPAAQAPVRQTPPPRPAPQATLVRSSAPVGSPVTRSAPEGWSAQPQPSWLSFRLIERNLSHKPGELTLFFAVEHSGGTPLLVMDATELHVQQNGVDLPVVVRQGVNPAVLRAGRTQTGTLVIQLTPGQQNLPFTLNWSLHDPAKQINYVVERRLERLPLR